MRVEGVIGANILARRRELDISQQELGTRLAPLLGKPWSRQAVSAAEHGERDFIAAELLALAVVLQVSLMQLVMPPPDVREVELRPGANKLGPNDLRLLFVVVSLEAETSRAVEAGFARRLHAQLGALRTATRELEALSTEQLERHSLLGIYQKEKA